MIKKGSTFFIISILSYFLSCCNSVEPPPDGQGINLKLEDVSCTEAWINLTTTNLPLPTTVTIKQNNQVRGTINLIKADTLVYVDSLLPNTSYQYQAYNSEYHVTSNKVTATTLDTTSHIFAWQTWTFGTIGSSTLYDVAIINENNIWAVGEIMIADTSQNGYTTYNAVHWDGSQWELKRINMLSSCNPVTYPPLRAIWAFSENNIVVTSGGSIGWFDGITNIPDCNIRPLLTGSINKIWGSSSNDLYVVGNNGNIAWYNGTRWTRIESGTDVDLLDVWGSPDGSIVWASGKNLNKTVLIKISNNQARIVFEDQPPWQIQQGRISGGISSIWTNSKNFIYVTTPVTVYRCLSNTSGEGKEIYPYDDYLNGGTVRIRGTAINNIVTSGSNSSILHYNGFSWKRYEELTDITTYLWSSDIKGNILVSIGDKLENIFYYKAIIIVGKK